MSQIYSCCKSFNFIKFALLLTFLYLNKNGLVYADERIIIPVNNTAMVSIDGQFSQAEWQGAAEVILDNVVQPFDNISAPVATTVYSFASDDTLYVAFIAFDDQPEAVRASYRDRDQIWGDDLVGIKLDTFNDARLAYQFFINPFGIQSDGIQNEMTGNESDSWDAIWESKGQITDNGYVVEVAIPLRIMNFDDRPGEKEWGIEFVRFFPRDNVYRITHLQYDRDNSCNLCQMGRAIGFDNATQGQNLAIVPTMVAGKSRERDIELGESDWVDETNQALSLDVKWGITPEISLQATLNPDFSQVESDAGQLSVNNTFALFFPERRPFFVENADYFTTNLNLVYTRNINAPDYGVKLTGRIGGHSLGMFFADDASTSFLIPGNLNSSVATLAQISQNFTARYRYDMDAQLSIGSVTTIRESDDYHNYVNGIDVKYKPNESDTIKVQWVHSETQYPHNLYVDLCDNDCTQVNDLSETALRVLNDKPFAGNAMSLQYARDTEHYFLRANHYRNSPGFRADMGFVSRADRYITVLGGGYLWRNDDNWFNYMRVSGDWDIHKNSAGELLEKEREIYFRVKGKFNTLIDVGGKISDRVGVRQFVLGDVDGELNTPDWTETLDRNALLSINDKTTLYTEDYMRLILETDPTDSMSVYQFFGQGKQIDFSNDRLGNEFKTETRISYDVGEHIRLSVDYEYQTLEAEGAEVYTAKLLDTRMTYQIDDKQFVRVILSVSDIQRNQNNYRDAVDAEYEDRGLQLLYSYKVNPLTKFFIGYSDAAYRNDNVKKVTANEQSLFMKFSYAWQQ